MKVPICPVCDKTPEQAPGDYHQSADYVPLPEGIMGHPQGLQWYCYEHMPKQDADTMAVPAPLPSIKPPSR